MESIRLGVAFFAIALLYAAVGQAGASGYLAVMALAGFAPAAMKTTALALNLLVAAIATFYFAWAGRLSWRSLWPFAVLGFPFSLLGGAIRLPEHTYYPVVGAVLLLSAAQTGRAALQKRIVPPEATTTPPVLAALVAGAAIGFVSGTTGTGGGVFLAPVILAMNWGTPRQTAGTTAVYNLVNSGAALIGAYAWWDQIPSALPWWLLAVAVGGSIGASLGSRHLSDRWLRGILALLLFASGLKLLWP